MRAGGGRAERAVGVWIAVLAGCLMVAALGLPALAAAAARAGDDWTHSTTPTLVPPRPGALPPDDNFGYTEQANEPLTPGSGTSCGVSMVKTHWYRFVADGLRTTVSTAGSGFDTVLEA